MFGQKAPPLKEFKKNLAAKGSEGAKNERAIF
jgi:hypothetical protein